MTADSERVSEYVKRWIDISSAKLGDEYYYQSLPLCVIDAVFSISVRYESVRNVISRYCIKFNLPRLRAERSILPTCDKQETITSLCAHYKQLGLSVMTEQIFYNRQRTSTTNGILKSEAVYRFAKCLRSHGVEYLQDIPLVSGSPAFEKQVLSIPGQASGTSLKYFWMLAGSDEFIKPDRMILAFLSDALGRSVKPWEAQSLLTDAALTLRRIYPHVTPRLLDHAIWQYQREIPRPRGTSWRRA